MVGLNKIQLVTGQVAVVSGVLTSIDTITNPVDVSGSTITIGNIGDVVPIVPTVNEIFLSDGTALTVKYATGSSAGAGDNTMIAAVATRIVPLSYSLSAVAAVNATFKSDTGGGATTLSLVHVLGIGGFIQRTYSPVGHFKTATAKPLNLYLSAALAVTWDIAYVEMP